MCLRNRLALKIFYGLLILISVLRLTSDTAHADKADVLKQAIQVQYSQMEALLDKSDVEGYMKMLAPNYKHRSLQGKTWDRKTYESLLLKMYPPPGDDNSNPLPAVIMEQLPPNSQVLDEIVNTQIRRFKLKRDIFVDERITVHAYPYTTADGVKHLLSIANRSEDSWVRSGDAWLLQSRKDLPIPRKLLIPRSEVKPRLR